MFAQKEETTTPLPNHFAALSAVLPSCHQHRRPREFQDRCVGKAEGLRPQYTAQGRDTEPHPTAKHLCAGDSWDSGPGLCRARNRAGAAAPSEAEVDVW
jgi:hypothetical protein